MGRVDAAEGQTTIEKIGEPQVEVDGMGRAQAAAKGDHAGEAVPAVALLGDILDLGHNFLHDVADPLLIAADAPVGVAVGVNIVAKGPAKLIGGSLVAVGIDAFDKLLNILRSVGTQHAGRCSTAHLA